MSRETKGDVGPRSGGEPRNVEGVIAEDVKTLHSMGYAQELLRRMGGFSNFAISFSIICIIAGGITSFQMGFCSIGGAGIGIGWPVCSALTLCIALTMGQVASAFPTAGGLYHWASILGGRGFGWATAWFNLIGLVTVLAAINVGAYLFIMSSLGPLFGVDLAKMSPDRAMMTQIIGVTLITGTQALFNHLGIRVTTLLTDFSGYLILAVSVLLTIAMLFYAPQIDLGRLVTFTNYSGPKGGDVWPETGSMTTLFLLSFLLPAYTITGYDASAHTSEETIGAAETVPRGIVRAVLVSGVFGWLMLSAIVLAMPDMNEAASKGGGVFFWIMESVIPERLRIALYAGISIAQYLCGLATVTSASRMTFAFARDGGLPLSEQLRKVSPRFRTPATAIWVVSALTVGFTVYTPVYSTITAVCVIFLYISYVMPTMMGVRAYGRTWVKMGPWDLGPLYRPLAIISVLACLMLIVVSVQPPNDKALFIMLIVFAVTAVVWFALERRRFQGPPQGVMIQQRAQEIAEAERAVGQVAAGGGR
ncbi:amino acid permease [Sorangium sp. So ce1078]|uniref:amino acid permease n=1 Tax=Sorangium sp. So ce1078 TaxID=3133329 RepID=UPI003F5FE645